MKIPTKEELQDFALRFDEDIVRPLVNSGYDRYNVFDILNISRQELRHSDFLAFLFAPSKSGDIGHQFLRNFLTLLAKDKIHRLDFFDMLYGNIEKVNVYREVAARDGRIDILIEFQVVKEKTQKIVIAIENKVDSDQHDDQLQKYREFLHSKYKSDYIKVMLYLTPDKADANCDEWIETDYQFIYKVLDRLDVEHTDSTIRILIDDYKKLLRSEFGMENIDETRQKALEIYKKNRQILDFIYQSRPDWVKVTSRIICELLEQKGAIIVTETNKGELIESKKKDSYNIMFITNDLANHKGHYFQISVKDMFLLFIDDKGKRQCNKQWLFGDSQESAKAVDRCQENVLDKAQIKADCTQMIDKAFADDGIIMYCLSTLKKR